jgi:hypothetical protein
MDRRIVSSEIPPTRDARPPWPRLGLWLGVLGLVVLTGLGTWARLAGMDQARMVMDALHPFLKALAIVRGDDLPWRGAGGDFRFGALQAWSMAPLVLAAASLRSLLSLYAVTHALAVPVIGLAGRRLGGWLTGLGAAGLYALWPVLLGHPHRGAQTYLAPVVLAAAVWVALRLLDPPPRASTRRGMGLAALLGALLALAVHHHPYAIAVAAAAVVLLPWLVRRRGWKALLAMAVSGAVVLAPMVVDNILLLRERQASGAGNSLVQDAGMLQETMGSLLHDASLQSLGTLSMTTGIWPMFLPLLALPLLLLDRRKVSPVALPMVAWGTASWVMLLVAAKTLGYLQPYHLAVVLPLHLLLASWGVLGLLCRLPVPRRAPFVQLRFVLGAVVGLGLVGGTWWALRVEVRGPLATPPAHIDQLGVLEPAVTALRVDAGSQPRVLGVLAETSRTRIGDPIAYFMDQWLAGEPDSSFLLIRPPAPGKPMVYVIADLDPVTWAAWPDTPAAIWSQPLPGGTRAAVLSFGDVGSARRWLRGGCPLFDERGLRMAGPWEGMAFMARDIRPYHEELVNWARVCDGE